MIDYTVRHGIATGSYTEQETGISTDSHIVLGLTAGVTYKFKVQSRNSYGLSAASSEVIILAA